MANTGKQSPLGVNVLGSLLQNIGFYINPTAQSYMGVNKYTEGEYTPGKIVNDTCLKWLTYAVNDAYARGQASKSNPVGIPDGSFTVDSTTYNNLLTIGQSRIAALGNSPPPTWETSDPGNVWVNQHTDFYTTDQAGSPANSGYGFYNWTASYEDYNDNREEAYKNEGQLASWYPFLTTVEIPAGQFIVGRTYQISDVGTTNFTLIGAASNTVGTVFTATGIGTGTGHAYGAVPNRGVTQWGWIRCMALQAWNEFNWNGQTIEQTDNSPSGSPAYQFFVDTFSSCDSFKNYSNEAIYAVEDSQSFLRGTYSNQDDLISADLAGVSLSSRAFGQDLINLGNGIDFNYIKTFGLPSSLLQILKKYNALTQPVILALLASGLSQGEIESIGNGNITPTKDQEQKIYGAFLVVVSTDLKEIQVILNCKTKGLTSLADLLSVKKMFPLSYTTLTVPIYNTAPGPTNSKTYYLLFIKQELNPQLVLPRIKEIVQVIVPPQPPPIVVDPPPLPPPPPPPKISEPEVIVIPQPPTIPAPPAVVPPPPAVIVPPPQPTGGGGGGCVALESFIPLVETDKKHNGREITKAWMLEADMKISLGTDDLQIVDGKVVKTLNDYQPCVRISTADGITLVCSTTAPILTKDSGFIPATEVYGKRVAVMRNGRTWFDEVVGLEDVGMKFVRVIDAGNNSFWAGERPGAFILHHNVPINDNMDMDKK